MSTVVLGHLAAGVGESGQIKVDDQLLCSQPILAPGCMTQYKYVRSDSRTTFSAATGAIDTLITPLAITITPRKIGDILHCQWTISGESHTNSGFRVAINGTVPSNGYNTEAGNVQWSVLAPASYDPDYSTTPSLYNLTYIFVATSTNELVITPTLRATGAATATLYFNRSLSSVGANDNENGVSFGWIMEVAQ